MAAKTPSDHALNAYDRDKALGRKKQTSIAMTAEEWAIVKPLSRVIVLHRNDRGLSGKELELQRKEVLLKLKLNLEGLE